MAAVLVDDLTIVDESLLLRRIPLKTSHIHWDSNRNRWRPTSQSFRNTDEILRAISVNLMQVLDELGLPPGEVLLDPSRYALVSISTGFARTLAQVVNRDALLDDPSHAHLLGEKKKPVQSALAEAAQWVIPPPWTCPP